MPAKRRDILVVVADTHIGSTVALCPPAVPLDDGGSYTPSAGQRWLWSCWLDFWTQVMATRPSGGGKRYVVHLGDICEGDHHETSQIVSRNPATMLDLAITVLEPVRQWADHMFVIRGTEAHAGKSAAMEEAIADDLNCTRDMARDTASWWHLLLEVQGVRIDCAHQPISASGRPWTRANGANVLAFATFSEYAEHGERPPDIALRAHLHRFSDSGSNYVTRAVIAPAWQLGTAYSNRRWPGQLADIGGQIWTITDGQPELRLVLYRPGPREPWRA